jgi:hypothetical protein
MTGSFGFPRVLAVAIQRLGTHIVKPVSRILRDLRSRCPDPRPKTGMALTKPTTGLREIVTVGLAEG